MVENYLSLPPNNASLRITLGDVSVIPGLGRHRLVVPASVSGDERSDGLTVIFTGEASVQNLGGVSGYLGTIMPTMPQSIRRDGSYQVMFYIEITDDQIRKIEDNRTQADGSFDLVLTVRVSGRASDGSPLSGGGNMFQPHRVSRDQWLAALFQLHFRKVLVAELEVPDGTVRPELARAFEFFERAQNQFLVGEYRLTVEALRQSLASLVGQSGEDEVSVEEMSAEIRSATRTAHDRGIRYPERMELARRALKFTADLGAHPEICETSRIEASSQLNMTAGLLQWFNRP